MQSNVCLSREREPLLQTVPNCREPRQHFPVQSSTRPSVVSTGWVPACFHSEANNIPLFLAKRKRRRKPWKDMEMMGKSIMWDAKCFFPFLNLVNLKALIVNLIRGLCDTLPPDKVLRCLSGVHDVPTGVRRLHLRHLFSQEGNPKTLF